MKNLFSIVTVCSLLLVGISSCSDDDTEDTRPFTLNFTAAYEGQPIVMGDTVEYPEGNIISFSKISYFISAVEAYDESSNSMELLEVEMIDFSTSNTSEAAAREGISMTFEEAPNNIDRIDFNLGLTAEQNAMSPDEYSADHPLAARSSEYWSGWESFVFAKLEGLIDLDGDGIMEETFALHLGSDDVRRSISINTSDMNTASNRELQINLEVTDIFNQDGNIYPITDTWRIHRLEQLDLAIDLIDNWSEAFVFTAE